MALLGEQILNLAKAAGLSGEEPELKSFLSNTAISGYELPDSIATKLNGNLLSIEAAKNNPKIKAHYYAQAYSGLDSEIERTADDFGFTPEEIVSLTSEKSSTKRAVLLAKMKVQKLEEELKGGDKSKGEKAELNRKIEELNTSIKDKDKLMNDKIAQVENSWKEKYTNTLLNNQLAGLSFADEAYKDENYLLPMTKVRKALNDKGLKIVLDNENVKLEQQDGSEYYENNVKVDTKTFVESVLAQNKFLKVSEPSNQGQNTGIVSSPTKSNDKWMAKATAMANEAKVDLTR